MLRPEDFELPDYHNKHDLFSEIDLTEAVYEEKPLGVEGHDGHTFYLAHDSPLLSPSSTLGQQSLLFSPEPTPDRFLEQHIIEAQPTKPSVFKRIKTWIQAFWKFLLSFFKKKQKVSTKVMKQFPFMSKKNDFIKLIRALEAGQNNEKERRACLEAIQCVAKKADKLLHYEQDLKKSSRCLCAVLKCLKTSYSPSLSKSFQELFLNEDYCTKNLARMASSAHALSCYYEKICHSMDNFYKENRGEISQYAQDYAKRIEDRATNLSLARVFKSTLSDAESIPSPEEDTKNFQCMCKKILAAYEHCAHSDLDRDITARLVSGLRTCSQTQPIQTTSPTGPVIKAYKFGSKFVD